MTPFEEDLRREREAEERVRAAVKRLADELADYPPMWTRGDGYGGSVIYNLRRAVADRGLEGWPPPPPKTRKTSKTRTQLKVYRRDAFRCVHCGEGGDLTVDHIVPVAKGGSDDLDNLQTLCRSCNSKKGAS